MNAWLTPIESAWQLAGWTMLHFLWLGAAIAAAGAVVRVALRRASPTLPYATSLTTLAALAVAPAAIAAWLAANAPEFGRISATDGEFFRNPHAKSRSDEAAAPNDLAVSPLPIASEPSGPLAPSPDALVGNPTPAPSAPRPLFDPTRFGNSEPVVQQAVELLPWAWLVGAPLTFAWLTAGLVGSRRLQRASSPLFDGPIADACQRLQRALGVTRRVALAVCDGLAQPVLVGIVKPTILLPASAVTGWTPEELEMALVHELAHVRRWDNLVNFLQRVIESLLFFHPAVWLVSRQVRRDREECCDAIVVSQTRQPEAYATLLVSIATKLRARPAAALAVASAMANHALAGRVRRILKLEDQPMWVSRRWLAALLAIALGLTTAVYGVAVAEPAADDETAADEDDAHESRAYPVADVDTVNFRDWMSFLGTHEDVEVVWHEPNGSMVITATSEEHDRIAELLTQSRRASGDDEAEDESESANPGLQEMTPEQREELRGLAEPGDVPAAIFVFPATPGEISLRLKELNSLGHNVRIANGDGFTVLFIKDLDPRTFRRPHRLAPYNVISVRVFGAPTEAPIDDAYDVEEEGTIALGPLYGRVAVEGMTILEAEAAISKHLSSILRDARVQITLLAREADEADDLDAAGGDGAADERLGLLDGNLSLSSSRSPHRLVPYNVISVRVMGAFPESPIDDSYTIEEEGTIALGPVYGRVAVEGLTVLEAEAAITKHLATILTDARVQVTLLAREGDAADVNPLVPDDVASEDASTASVPIEMRRIEAEIRHCQLLLARIDAEFNDIEVMKEVALQNAENADAIEGLDAVIAQVQDRIADLDERIARFLTQGKDDADPELAMLDAERESEAELLDALLARVRQENIPNEALQAAVTEYEVRKKYLEVKKAEIEERLAKAQARLAEADEEAGDGARGAAAREDDSTNDGVNAQAELQETVEQLRDVERRLAELEIPRIPLDPRAVGPASPAELDADPTLQMYQQQLFALSQQIQALQAKSRNGGGAQLRQLQAAYEQTQTQMDAYRAAAKRELETRVAELDEGEREELQARIDEYHAQLETLLKERSTLQRRIVEMEMAVGLMAERGGGAGGGDASARGEAEPILDDAVAAPAGVRGGTAFERPWSEAEAEATREHEELMLLMFELFQESESNPASTETYALSGTSDEFPKLWLDALEGWKQDPYGPRLQFEMERLDDGERLRVTAARDAHVLFGALFTHLADIAKWREEHDDGAPREGAGEPVEVGYPVQSDAAEIIVRLWASTFAGSDDVTAEWHDASRSLVLRAPPDLHGMFIELVRSLSPDATSETSPDLSLTIPDAAGAVPYPRLALEAVATTSLVTLPEGVDDADARRIARDLRRQGYLAMAGVRDGELFLQIALPPGRKLVWETRMGPDGEPLMDCRVVIEETGAPVDGFVYPQPAAGGGDAPARGEGEGDLDAAEQSERLEIIPPSAVEATNMGLEMLPDGEYRRAIKAFNVAIAADATFAEAHIGKGDALKALGYFPEAAQSYSRALEIDAHLPTAYTGRGSCFLAVSPPDYDLALNDFQNALDLDRDNIVALSSVGRIYAENAEDPQRAIPFLSEALQLDARNDDLYRSRATAHLRLGQFDLAEKDARAAVDLHPSDPQNEATLQAVLSRRQMAEEEATRGAGGGDVSARAAEESDDDYRYDGKTFAEWQNLWRHELKIERRIEAIAALTAFGRTAYPQEAAEAVLDVAGEYDFRNWGDGLENRLKNAVAETFCKQAGGIAPEVWLPILVSRVRESEGPTQRHWRDMLPKLLEKWEHDGHEPHDLMIELAEDEAVGVQDEALYVLARGISNSSDPQVVQLLRTSLAGPKPSGLVMRTLAFNNLDVLPEQLDLFFHDNPEIQAGARRVLEHVDLEDRWTTVYEPLAAVLDDPDRSADHLAAIRAIAVLWPHLNKEWSQYPEIIARHQRTMRDGAEELIPPTMWLLAKIWGSDWDYVISNLQQSDSTRLTEDRVTLVQEAARKLGVEERAIFGR